MEQLKTIKRLAWMIQVQFVVVLKQLKCAGTKKCYITRLIVGIQATVFSGAEPSLLLTN